MKNINRVHDLTGQRFDRLAVIGMDDVDSRKTYWVCQCDCGNIKSVRSDGLISGNVRSCGCLKKEQDKTNFAKSECNQKYIKTGFKVGGTRLYRIWQGMKRRCYKKSEPCYDRYGGRGITVCDEWKNDFVAFYNWATNNGYSDELTIDRIDNSKGYSPDNCRWVTQTEQARNRRSNINITIGNSTRTLVEWCEIFDINYSLASSRYQRNGYIGIDQLFSAERG